MSSLSYFISNDIFKLFSRYNDDDKIDKLCRKYSAIIMLVVAFCLAPFKLISAGITCWCHNEYSGTHCKVITNFCYVSEKFIPASNASSVLPSMKTVMSHSINYYQWIVYVFVTLACVSYVPCLIWHWFVKAFGYNINLYIEKIESDKSLESEKTSEYIAKDILRCLSNVRMYRYRSNFTKQAWLFFSYILVKCLYGFSIIFQIWFLNYVFQDEYHRESDIQLIETRLTNLQRFPRIIFCKLDLQTLYDYQRHWVQCILPDNIYIEKAYIFVMYWLYFVLILNVFSIVYYFIFIIYGFRSYINSRIKNEEIDVEELTNFMTVDSILALRIVNSNTYDFKITGILKSLHKINSEQQKDL